MTEAPPLRILYLDFETYYDDEYSLRKMTTPAYILDNRWETILVAVKEGDAPSRVIDGPDFPAFLKTYDPENTVTVTYNSLFDNSILSWRYGFVPKLMLDPMNMARALHGHELPSLSLEKVASFFQLGAKGKALLKVKGLHRQDIKDAGLWQEFSDYANMDNELCAGIFKILSPKFPEPECRVMDLVIRAAVLPKFHVNLALLCDHIEAVQAEKAKLLAACGVGVDELMSAAKFSAELDKLGVPIVYKTTKAGNQVPAIAKTDDFMNELLEHDDPAVQALAAARIGHKSTLEETRGVKLLSIATLPWESFRPGNFACMPIPLRYGGAHTHRLSGEWKMNMQNMPRGGNLRKSLIPPPGYAVVVADLAQIEARITAWIAGETVLLKQFADKLDPYAIMGSKIFGRPVDPKVDKMERFIGKTAILGLGYGCGWERFYDMARKDARKFGVNLGTVWTPLFAKAAVDTYRQTNANINRAWQRLDQIVAGPWFDAHTPPTNFGPTTISYGTVLLPNRMELKYARPRKEKGEWPNGGEKTEYYYTYGREPHLMYGATMLENIVQALARIVVMNAAMRLSHRGYDFVLQAHDELAFIVPLEDVDNAKKIIYTEMTRNPSWGPDIPLGASCESGPSYGEAK